MDIQDLVAGSVRPTAPEAVSVRVLTTDPELAAQVGPLLARKLHPTRRFGQVLHLELDGQGATLVDVQVTHPLSAVRQSAGNGR